MVDSSKLVYGDQFQIRLDPGKLDAKNRGAWGRLYIAKQAEKGRMLFHSSAIALASAASFVAGVQFDSNFLVLAFVLGAFALRSFYKFGYDKGILDDWETKIMIRVDK